MASNVLIEGVSAVTTRGVGVFSDNRRRAIHRWYPFVEGYSSALVERALDSARDASVLFDPFGGSGTTSLTAALRGTDSAFTEANPYMAWLADVKVNGVARALETPEGVADLRAIVKHSSAKPRDNEHPLIRVSRKRDYLPPGVAEAIVSTLEIIDENLTGPVRELARVAVATSITASSNMVRRTDLRRRRPGEAMPADFRELFVARVHDIADDVEQAGPLVRGAATNLGQDAKGEYRPYAPFSLIVTSPPYLNGTNYGRNTKLELLALGHLDEEHELEALRTREITAGINNVAKRNAEAAYIPSVEAVALQVEARAYDRRIPAMIRAYFSEMKSVFERIHDRSAPNAELWLDIGDSRYSGVSVRTDDLLVDVAATAGWAVGNREVIRRRKSYDGTELTQALIRFDRMDDK